MKYRHFYLRFHFFLLLIFFVVSYLMFSLKGIGYQPLDLFPVDSDHAEVWFVIVSGICIGILVYFFTAVLPVGLAYVHNRKRLERELRSFVDYSMTSLKESGLSFPENISNDSKVEFVESVGGKLYDYRDQNSPRSHPFYKRLRGIRNRRDRLSDSTSMYSNDWLNSDLIECVDRVLDVKLLSRGDLHYLTLSEDELQGKKIGVASFLWDFYIVLDGIIDEFPDLDPVKTGDQ